MTSFQLSALASSTAGLAAQVKSHDSELYTTAERERMRVAKEQLSAVSRAVRRRAADMQRAAEQAERERQLALIEAVAPLSEAQERILSQFATEREATASALGDLSGYSAGTATRILRALQARELVDSWQSADEELWQTSEVGQLMAERIAGWSRTGVVL
jgi:ribosomal protein S25